MATMLTVPEYFKKYIDPTVDLNITPKIPCPFHHEDKPSFSFKPDKDIWRCFGACKTGGDVYMLHKANFKLKTKEEAMESLHALEHIEYHPSFIEKKEYYANETDVSFGISYSSAVSCAKSIDDYIELDYIMSQSPVSIRELENYCTVRGK